MLIYFFQIIWVGACGLILYKRVHSKYINSRQLYLLITFTLLTFIMAFRSPHMGTDTYTYYRMFYKIGQSKTLWEAFDNSTITAPVYVIINRILYVLFGDGRSEIIFNAIFINVGIAIFIYKTSPNVLLSTFCYIGLALYYSGMNATRQLMAVVLVINAFIYFSVNIKSIKGWIFFILAIGIHNTAFIFLFGVGGIYLSKRIKNITKLNAIILTVCVGFSVAFYALLNIALKIFPYFKMYVNGENNASILTQNDGGRIIFLYLSLAVVTFLLFFELYFSKPVTGKCISINYAYALYPMTIITVVIGISFCRNMLINRLLWYFSTFFISAIPIAYSKFSQKCKVIFYSSTFIILMVYTIFQLIEDKSDIVPYHFWI